MPIALIVLLLLGGGVSYAAEQSVPGSPLYAVKVSFNEEIRSALTLSPEARAAWEVSRAERRLEEAETLVVAGRLNAGVRGNLEERFEGHANKVTERIERLEDQGNVEAAARLSSNLEAALQAHERILAALTASVPTSTEQGVDVLKLKVKARKDGAIELRSRIELHFTLGTSTSTSTPPVISTSTPTSTTLFMRAAAGRINAAQHKIDEARRFISDRGDRVDAAARASAEARLAVAVTTLADANTKFAAGAYGEAFILAGSAHRIAQEAKLLLSAGFRLKLDIDDDDEDDDDDDSATTTATSTDDDDDEDDDDNNSGSNRGKGRGLGGIIRADLEVEID